MSTCRFVSLCLFLIAGWNAEQINTERNIHKETLLKPDRNGGFHSSSLPGLTFSPQKKYKTTWKKYLAAIPAGQEINFLWHNGKEMDSA